MNIINNISYIGSVVSLKVGLRNDRRHDDVCKKWIRSVNHIFLHRIDILIEMQNFLRINKKVHKTETDYAAISRSVTRLLNQGRGDNSIRSCWWMTIGRTTRYFGWLMTSVNKEWALFNTNTCCSQTRY